MSAAVAEPTRPPAVHSPVSRRDDDYRIDSLPPIDMDSIPIAEPPSDVQVLAGRASSRRATRCRRSTARC